MDDMKFQATSPKPESLEISLTLPFTTFLNLMKLAILLQMSYSLVVIFELNGVSEVQYKEIMIIDDE